MTIDYAELRRMAEAAVVKDGPMDSFDVIRRLKLVEALKPEVVIEMLDVIREMNQDLDFQTRRNNFNRDANERLLKDRSRLFKVLKDARILCDLDGVYTALGDTVEIYNLSDRVRECADIEPEVKD